MGFDQPFEGSMTPIIHCNDGAAGGGRRECEAYYNVDNGLLGRGAAAVANTPTPLRHSTSTNQQHEQQHDQGYGEGSSGGDGNTQSQKRKAAVIDKEGGGEEFFAEPSKGAFRWFNHLNSLIHMDP